MRKKQRSAPPAPLFADPTRPIGQQGPGVRPVRWAVAGLLLGLISGLIIFAPASWLAAIVERASGGSVVFAEPRGTIWKGSARLLLTGGKGSQESALLPERLRWDTALSGFGLRLDMLLECCASQAVRITVSPGLGAPEINIDGVNLNIPASVLTGLGTPFNTLGFQGQIKLQTQHARIQTKHQQIQFDGNVGLSLIDLSSQLSTVPILGSYQLDLMGGAQPRVKLATLSGALIMEGQGNWQKGRLHFEGRASAAPGYEETLANILNIIGRRAGNYSVIKI